MKGIKIYYYVLYILYKLLICKNHIRIKGLEFFKASNEYFF